MSCLYMHTAGVYSWWAREFAPIWKFCFSILSQMDSCYPYFCQYAKTSHLSTLHNNRSRGSGPFVPSKKKIWRAPFSSFFCFGGNREHPKTDRRQTKRGPFFDKMIIPPPHCRNFPIDLQQRWSINRKIGNRQCTFYLIVRALTVAVFLFFCRRRTRAQ